MGMSPQAGARAQVAAVKDLAEVRASNDLGRQRALVGKVLQRRAQQADAVRRQRALAKLVNDAQRPAAAEPCFTRLKLPPLAQADTGWLLASKTCVRSIAMQVCTCT